MKAESQLTLLLIHGHGYVEGGKGKMFQWKEASGKGREEEDGRKSAGEVVWFWRQKNKFVIFFSFTPPSSQRTRVKSSTPRSQPIRKTWGICPSDLKGRRKGREEGGVDAIFLSELADQKL